MSLSELFQLASDWLKGLPDGVRDIVAGLILAAILAIVPALQWSSRTLSRIRQRRKARDSAAASALAAARDALRADFLKEPASLGILDHGVNTTTTMDSMMGLLRRVSPIVDRTTKQLLHDTPAKLPPKTDPDSVAKKQTVLRETALSLHADTRELEEAAVIIAPQATAFIAAYRSVFTLPVESDTDRATLLEIRSLYGGKIAEAFKQCTDVLRSKRDDFRKFEGKQQDLTRMLNRMTAAMDKIANATESVATFCAVEMATTITGLLAASSSISNNADAANRLATRDKVDKITTKAIGNQHDGDE